MARRAAVSAVLLLSAVTATGAHGGADRFDPSRLEGFRASEFPESEVANFHHAVLADRLVSDLEHFWPETAYMGLAYQAAWIWGAVYDAEGHPFVFTRELPPFATNGLTLFGKRSDSGLEISPEAMQTYRGTVVTERAGDAIEWRSADQVFLGTPSMQITKTRDHFSWKEAGILDLSGATQTAGYQWYDPPPAPQAYVATYQKVHGTVLGRPVSGWLGFDVLWLEPGRNYGRSPMARGLVLSWAAFATEYDNGTIETGAIVKGFENFDFAVIADNRGGKILGARVRARYEQFDDGYPKRFDFRFVDTVSGTPQHWVWKAVPGTALVDIPKFNPAVPRYRGSEGVMTRADEKRRVVSSVSWPDFYDDGRVQVYESLRSD